jgi:hypothetical protein
VLTIVENGPGACPTKINQTSSNRPENKIPTQAHKPPKNVASMIQVPWLCSRFSIGDSMSGTLSQFPRCESARCTVFSAIVPSSSGTNKPNKKMRRARLYQAVFSGVELEWK